MREEVRVMLHLTTHSGAESEALWPAFPRSRHISGEAQTFVHLRERENFDVGLTAPASIITNYSWATIPYFRARSVLPKVDSFRT